MAVPVARAQNLFLDDSKFTHAAQRVARLDRVCGADFELRGQTNDAAPLPCAKTEKQP